MTYVTLLRSVTWNPGGGVGGGEIPNEKAEDPRRLAQGPSGMKYS